MRPSDIQIAENLMRNGQIAAAITNLEKNLKDRPDDPDIIDALGRAYILKGDMWNGLAHFQKAVDLAGNVPEFLVNLGTVTLKTGRPDLALKLADKANKIRPRNAQTLKLQVESLFELGRIKKAKTLLENARNDGFRDVDLDIDIARFESLLNNETKALEIFRQVHQAGQSRAGSLFGIVEAMPASDPFPEKDYILSALGTGKLRIGDQMTLHHAMGRYFDKIANYERAWHHFERSNAPKRRSPDGSERLGAKLRQFETEVTREKIEQAQTFGNASRRPIFIIGMPRSGTSLAEQILSSHPKIHGAGELNFLSIQAERFGLEALKEEHIQHLSQDYLNLLKAFDPKAKHVVDKLPLNFEHLWLIASLFPNAKIIHCRRDPIATCVSCLTNPLSAKHDYSCDQETLVRYYKAYEKMMALWEKVLPIEIIELRYDTLVLEPEATIRELFSRCDIQWSDKVLEFHKTKRAVKTPSKNQVNKPISKEALIKWRRYEEFASRIVDEFS